MRAALFHLGALRRLHEVGILQTADAVSSVSGGSILAAFIAQLAAREGLGGGWCFEDWNTQVAIPFQAFAGRDLRTWPVLATAGWNALVPAARLRLLTSLYRRRVNSLRLCDLPE